MSLCGSLGSSSPARRSLMSSPLPGNSLEFELDEVDATHRGCHRFVPRHPGELAIEISDPIYVEVEEDDLWCEGINLRTKQRGIFPTAYATDLSILDDGLFRKFLTRLFKKILFKYYKLLIVNLTYLISKGYCDLWRLIKDCWRKHVVVTDCLHITF